MACGDLKIKSIGSPGLPVFPGVMKKNRIKQKKILGKIKRDCSVLVEDTNLNEEFKIREKPTFSKICPLSA